MGTRRLTNRIPRFMVKVSKAHVISRNFLMFLVVAGVMVLLTACSPSAPASQSKTQPAPASPAAGKLTPVLGGTLKVAWPQKPGPTFGLPMSARGAGATILGLCAEALVRPTAQVGVYEPVLAESWEFAKDNSYCTFKIRKGIKFSDGTDLNAAAVKWNHDRVLASAVPRIRNVTSIDQIDDYTLRYNLKSLDAFFLYDFTWGDTMTIVSPTAYKTKGEDWALANPVGTGPWILSEFNQNQSVIFKKNPDYWMKGIPYLDEIQLLTYMDPLVTMASIQRGEVDVWRELDVASGKTLNDMGKFTTEVVTAGDFVLWFNNTDPASPWSKQAMREALEYGINKEVNAKALGSGFSQGTYECLFGINEIGKPGTTPRKYDPEKAKQLVKDAGYPNGVKVKLETNTKFAASTFVQALQSDLAKVGINIELSVQADAAWAELSRLPATGSTLRYDRQQGGGITSFQSAVDQWGTGSTTFAGEKRPDGIQALIDKAKNSQDPAVQQASLEEMERLLYKELTIIPLWTNPDIIAYSSNVKWDPSVRKSLWAIAGRGSFFVQYAWLQK